MFCIIWPFSHHLADILLWKTVTVGCKVVQRTYTGNTPALCLGFLSHPAWVDNGICNKIWFYWGQCHVINGSLLDSDTDPCLPSVYYCNISSFQSWVTNHVDMTSTSSMLAVFVYKNKQVVQIQIQFSHVEAVSTRVEFAVYSDMRR